MCTKGAPRTVKQGKLTVTNAAAKSQQDTKNCTEFLNKDTENCTDFFNKDTKTARIFSTKAR